MSKQPLTHERLLHLLSYNEVEGVFTWNVTNSARATAGKRAGTINGPGYRCIQLDGVIYTEHRLAMFYVNGTWTEFVDHINGVRSDNRMANLREATPLSNSWNSALRRNNTSGYTGVCWHKQNRKWKVQLQFKGKSYSFGLYDDVHEAGKVADRERENLHKEFARHRGKFRNSPST